MLSFIEFLTEAKAKPVDPHISEVQGSSWYHPETGKVLAFDEDDFSHQTYFIKNHKNFGIDPQILKANLKDVKDSVDTIEGHPLKFLFDAGWVRSYADGKDVNFEGNTRQVHETVRRHANKIPDATYRIDIADPKSVHATAKSISHELMEPEHVDRFISSKGRPHRDYTTIL